MTEEAWNFWKRLDL